MQRRLLALAAAMILAAGPAFAAKPPPAYAPITPRPEVEATTVVLNGHDLTIESVLAVARDGAKVRFAPEAIASAEAGRALLAQGAAQGVSMYTVNRGAGALREQRVTRPENAGLEGAKAGARAPGGLPEIDEEELVRAFLVIQANHIPYNAATREYMEAITGLLNARVTPVMYSRGTLGEGDLFLTSNYKATLVGRGEAYFKGVRMPAAEALSKAGLKPITTATGGGTTNAYATAIAVLLVDEGRYALEWADLTLAMDLLGMNSSITPLTPPIQQRRPWPWLAWQADKTLGLLRGTYLTEMDEHRVLQDPESLRASSIRLGSAWQAWADLRASVTLQMNSGEQNPAIFLGARPTDAWALATPWVSQYYIKPGALSALGGFVLSNANWDPYPMTNQVEAFNTAFANMAVTVASRIDHFSDRLPTPFFTGIKPAEVLSAEQIRLSPYIQEPFFTYTDLWKELQTLTQSVSPDASHSDAGVADLEAMSRLKGSRGRQAVSLFMQLAGYDLWVSTYWLDVRKAQGPQRQFGPAATAAWTAFRKVLPWQQEPDLRGDKPYGLLAYEFMMANPARSFTGVAPPMPTSATLPAAR